jgi:hypothetical protein
VKRTHIQREGEKEEEMLYNVPLKLHDVGDERVTCITADYTYIAIVSGNDFKKEDSSSGIEKWYATKLGEKITDHLNHVDGTILGLYIYDEDRYNYDGIILPERHIIKNKIGEIFHIIRRRYKDSLDGILALTSCSSCNRIIKVGNPLGNMKYAVGGTYMCDICTSSVVETNGCTNV